MNKLFGLFLLALAFLAPSSAEAASRFWVGGTGTWDAADTTHWSGSSGGAGGSSVPGAADTVTFDGASGGGTVTVNFGGTITILQLTFGAFTGTLDFATNNNSITLTATNGGVDGSGTGTRTLNMGSGTWTLSHNSAFWNFFTVTNFTFNANSSTIAFTGTGGTQAKRFIGSGKTFSTITVAGGPSGFSIDGTNTIGTLTVAGPNRILFPRSTTTTITTLTNVSGTASNPVLFETNDPVTGVATISSANNFTGDFLGLQGMTFTGGGTFTANNSFNFGNNTGITINAPSGGGGGGRIIGG